MCSLVIVKQPGQSYVNKTLDSLLPFVYEIFTSESSHKSQQHGPPSVNTYDVGEKDCKSVSHQSSLHMTSKCLPPSQQHLTLPVISVLNSQNATVEYLSLAPSPHNVIQMVRQIANESGWSSIAYISDERWDIQLLNGLAHANSSVKVSTIIQQTKNLNFKKEASRILSLSIDAVVVHCQNARCFNAAKEIYMLVSTRSAAPWLFTNGFYQHIFASDLQSRTSGDMMTRALLLGIERTVLRSHTTAALMNFQDLPTAKPSKSDLFDLYDGIIVMAHLLHSIEFREVSMRQRVNMLNIRGASGPVQFETSSGGRIGGVYEVVCMNPFTYSVLSIGTYDLNHSEWLHKLPSLLPLRQPTRHRREATETIKNSSCPPVSDNTRHFRVTTVPVGACTCQKLL
ncbi:uncharacterized protein LOC134180822 [Corticium candelabrum]|uniref:uncharacterized protein LOC134180822 n=1 Tax=Corticium candelabrum TaxID=121492 RepID=UPI002E26990F|nr:uncharacterized protein LOC134180822 [Corticium candelabrum]